MKFTTPIVIGLECHVELDTLSKLFCSCKNQREAPPNSLTCPTCLGHPGANPVVNAKVIEYALKLCLALHCTIAPQVIFSRKSYFYPDMAKNYQITQHEEPLGTKGVLNLESGKQVTLERIHIEEDPAALIHKEGYCLVDYNRSGSPLLEVVTAPEMSSPEEARDFLKSLITILKYLDIFDPDHNIIKADANISIKESNYTRVEIKNISGFKEIQKALEYEIQRQQQNPSDIIQETRGWDPNKQITISQRKKEEEADYGYIIDPDLVPLDVSEDLVNTLKKDLPELAGFKEEKFKELGITDENARIISKDKALAELLEKVSQEVDPNLAAKWIRREVLRILNLHKKPASSIQVHGLIHLFKAIQAKHITDRRAQELLETFILKPFDIKTALMSETMVQDTELLTSICKQVILKNQKAVEDYKKGEEKSFNFLVGQVMKETKGRADPATIKETLKKLL